MHSDETLESMRDEVVATWGVDPERTAIAGEGDIIDVLRHGVERPLVPLPTERVPAEGDR